MGLKNANSNNVDLQESLTQQAPYENANQPRPNLKAGKVRLGFGGPIGGYNFMTTNKGSEYTTEISKYIKEAYARKREEGCELEVITFDKELDTTVLSYSVIVVCLLDKEEDRVNYFSILLGSTGQAPLTAQEINNEIELTKNSAPGYRPRIYTIDDAINDTLYEIVSEKLAQRFSAKFANPVDGVVVLDYDNDADIKDVAMNLANMAYNAVYAESIVPTASDDINITVAKEDLQNAQFQIITNMTKSPTVSPIGEAIRSDWKVGLILSDGNKQTDIMNSISPDIHIANVTGFIDAIPHEDPEITKLYTGTVPPGTPINNIRMQPQIIVTGMGTQVPTPGFALMAILSSLVMTERDMYVKALFPTDKKNHVGFLNRITKVNNSDAVLEIANSKYDENQVANAILSMFTLNPVVSLDIQNYGCQAFYTSLFAKAARPDNSPEKVGAAKYIIELAHNLTNGRFPLNFDINNIFTNQGIIIPMGYYRTNEGIRDIRDIDLTFIMSKTDNEDLAKAWVQSSVSGYVDNFITRVNVISQIVKDAVITSKAVRVTFTSDFIYALQQAATEAGFSCKFKSDFSINPVQSIAVDSNYFDRGAIGGRNLGFLYHQGPNRSTYSTRYIGGGYGRWGQ